jgi:very-short-patch-repair endonuclease
MPAGNRRLGKAMRRRLTPAELKLWNVIRGRQLEGLRFRRQAPIGDYIADFVCFERRIVVELDGGQHFRHHGVLADADRDTWMHGEGFLVLRFANADVMADSDAVCRAILSAAVDRDPVELRNPSPKPALPVSALPQGEG